jgi:hypothetical protein
MIRPTKTARSNPPPAAVLAAMATLLSWNPPEAVVASADVLADDVYVLVSEELLEALAVWVIVDLDVLVDGGNVTARLRASCTDVVVLLESRSRLCWEAYWIPEAFR